MKNQTKSNPAGGKAPCRALQRREHLQQSYKILKNLHDENP